MLVLTRKKDETVWIGDEVRVTVLSFRGDAVRLGIDAPADVEVHRHEVYLAKLREREINADFRGSAPTGVD